MAMILFCLGSINISHAGYIRYEFTVTAPFVHGSETIGGASDPVRFLFRVDENAENLSGSPTDAVYPINDHGFGGYGTVGYSGATTNLLGGLIQISSTSSGQNFLATTNGNVGETLINGRKLFSSNVSLFDPSGSMFGSLGLPITDSFSSYATHGLFRLTFMANPDDVEYQREAVYFDVFPVKQGDFTLVVSAVPVPPTFILMLTGLGLLTLTKRVRKAI
jgi:hypothetical protein